ncbi:MAG: hypothetical protein V3R13_03230, partial [Nitrososphaerales archaeon]
MATASPTSHVRLAFATRPKRSGTFSHRILSPRLSYLGGGEIITTLSPLTIIVPKSFVFPSSI